MASHKVVDVYGLLLCTLYGELQLACGDDVSCWLVVVCNAKGMSEIGDKESVLRDDNCAGVIGVVVLPVVEYLAGMWDGIDMDSIVRHI